jgi:hypothetical protein
MFPDCVKQNLRQSLTVTLDIISDFTDMSPEELRTAAYEALQAGNIQSYVRFS